MALDAAIPCGADLPFGDSKSGMRTWCDLRCDLHCDLRCDLRCLCCDRSTSSRPTSSPAAHYLAHYSDRLPAGARKAFVCSLITWRTVSSSFSA
eukprot:CAMPEP_0174712670 /NCGR_PEP_ID=MMETSP1094-20130205/13598_1 /TAXON_ID=156173 /ORGANISM="Chrysochromulina brevifilum, Strain UTEX LB 985" /LENGTH=93 /DNA_ID=CAMNT_0015911765 /DNA_START=251 /DNA_END=528 /DNA_ORIENTATION=-